MWRSYLLKKDFWAKKGNEQDITGEKIYIKHDLNGPIYAVIKPNERGCQFIADGESHFFSNFDKADNFLNRFNKMQEDFIKIIRRKSLSQKLRTLEF